jgi:ABC-type nitrate/sulfonate/bicarbonate transport system permease component
MTAPRSGTWRGAAWRGLVVPAALLVLAEIAAAVTHLESDALARPSEIVLAALKALADGSLLLATAQTLWAAASGLALGIPIGFATGVVLGLFPVIDRLMNFSIEALRPVPSIALIPVFMMVFGFGFRMESATVAFATVWPVLILTRAAVAGIEPRLFEVARILGLGLVARTWKIVLPAALPRLFVALRLSIGVALIVAVTVEIAANPLGLGNAMMAAQQSLHPDLMLAHLLWLGVVGWLLNATLLWLQGRLFGHSPPMDTA